MFASTCMLESSLFANREHYATSSDATSVTTFFSSVTVAQPLLKQCSFSSINW